MRSPAGRCHVTAAITRPGPSPDYRRMELTVSPLAARPAMLDARVGAERQRPRATARPGGGTKAAMTFLDVEQAGNR
jgi:hypothetical protein